jgi:hypothetical protein
MQTREPRPRVDSSAAGPKPFAIRLLLGNGYVPLASHSNDVFFVHRSLENLEAVTQVAAPFSMSQCLARNAFGPVGCEVRKKSAMHAHLSHPAYRPGARAHLAELWQQPWDRAPLALNPKP